jgi:hypothetical protein
MRYRPGTAGATYPKPVADSCGSCHVDTHALSGSEGRWTDCASCHSEARWAPSDYGVARHAASVFPLTGAHEVTPCYACHLEPDRGHARFTLGLDAASCAACHAEESPHGDLYPDQPCASCHVTEAFDVVSFDHTGIDTGPESGACATCHQADDPHRDQFPDRSCAACHGTESFRPLDRPFAHEATAFPLDGAHAEVACLACHRTEQDVEGPFVRYRPLGTECVDCHGGDQ